jgi:outer membrane receptor for ferrienterochelin and colicin
MQTVSYMIARINQYDVYYNVVPLLTPHWLSNTTIDYAPIPFELIATGKYVGESYLDNQNTQTCPASFVVDVIGKFYIGKHNLSVHINNIFDKSYYTSGYVVEGVPHYYVQAGRNFYISFIMGL